jgi:DNA invertase Pin-like site-specific DNA recombinase
VRGGHVGHLIVVSLDRLSRDPADLAAFRKEVNYHGVTLHILDLGGKTSNTPAGNLMTGIMAEAAQMVRGQIREKTRNALDGKRIKSEKLGGPVPYGQSVYVNAAGVKCLRECPGEQAVIRRARELRAARLSYRRIGEQLLEEGHAPRTGGPWPHESIRRMMEQG